MSIDTHILHIPSVSTAPSAIQPGDWQTRKTFLEGAEDKELTLMIPDSTISIKTTSRIMLNVACRKIRTRGIKKKIKSNINQDWLQVDMSLNMNTTDKYSIQ